MQDDPDHMSKGNTMEDNKLKRSGPHSIYLEDRKKLTVTDVTDIENFNEEAILINLSGGSLAVKGQGLHIQRLDLDEGKVIITGFVNSAVYTEKKDRQDKGFLKKILK